LWKFFLIQTRINDVFLLFFDESCLNNTGYIYILNFSMALSNIKVKGKGKVIPVQAVEALRVAGG
jgi:hypothetical protein